MERFREEVAAAVEAEVDAGFGLLRAEHIERLLWRDQIVELRNAAEPPRIMMWERAATWGRAEYQP